MPLPAARRFPLPPHRAVAESPLGGLDAVVLFLVVAGLVASWAAVVIPTENSVTIVDSEGKFVITQIKTPLYYAVHGLELGSVIAAGLLSILRGRAGILGTGVRAAFCVLVAAAAIWASIAYTAEEILSSSIFGGTGPFVWFTLVFVIAGVDRRIWNYIDPVIRTLAYLSAALALRALMFSEYRYYRAFSKYIMYTMLLVWLGGWALLTATRLRGWRLLGRVALFLVMVFMAICSQSRSWIILSCLLGVLFVLLRSRDQGSVLSGIRTLIMGGAATVAAAALVYVAIPHTLSNSVNGIVARINEDTRTGQYRQFFSVVPVPDLFLGKGPKGTWYWKDLGEYQFFDNGYLWMLFVGGMPTLVCYVAIVVWPAIRSFYYQPRGADAAAMYLVLLWALALTGLSTFTLPSVGITSYLVSLWAGRCHSLLAERAGRQFAGARTAPKYVFPRVGGRAYQLNQCVIQAQERAWARLLRVDTQEYGGRRADHGFLHR